MFTHPELLVSRLLFVGLIVEAFDIFKLRRAFGDDGMFSRSNIAILTSGARWQVRIGATAGGSAAMMLAMAAQGLSALVVIIKGTHTRAGMYSALICLVTNGYVRSRRQIGGSGAEQLTFIVLVTFGLVLLAGGTDSARRLGDAFIAAQVVLAYFASGVAKAASPIWRNGGAMTGILSTEGYGLPGLAKLLGRYPKLDWLLCWSVIGWEITFPLVLFVPKPLMLVLLSVGVVFHVSCAIVMGLNRFVWAFCGCYPAVWATAMLLS
ncbi:MAG TPA: hypothetical protein VF240_17115 [Pyrinomonadaceae bacterium]